MFIVLCGGVCAQDGQSQDQLNFLLDQKFPALIFQPILEFQKHFHYTETNAVKLSTFQ
jgi:hypothetical protein